MTEHESLNRAITEAIVIVPYDPAWPAGFEAERRRLLLLAPGVFLGIEHIGSTAVPELAAKPIVDIMAAVPSMEAADRLLAVLCQNGYATSAEFNATLRDRRWLMRQFNGRRTHHLHLVLPGGRYWNVCRIETETGRLPLRRPRGLFRGQNSIYCGSIM